MNHKATARAVEIARSRVDSGITVVCKWGTHINGKSYQRSPLETHKGWQYTTYYDGERRLCIARRKLPDGAWEIIRFKDHHFIGEDTHNVTVLGICPNDGTIHLAFDHHASSLKYRVSKTGAADHPGDVEWDTSLFSEVRDYLKEGSPLASITYPTFVQTPQGNLLFFSREGVPISGRLTLAEYAPESGGWSDRMTVTSSEGTYQFEEHVSTGRYAYFNGVHYGPTGRLHLSWSWRERMGSVFRDLNYAKSDDNGRTWFGSNGRQVGCVEDPISMDDAAIRVQEVTPRQGQDNMMCQYVDALDRPHIVISRLRNEEPLLRVGYRDLTRHAYYHYWLDEAGTWHENEVLFPIWDFSHEIEPGFENKGGDNVRNHRPKLLSTPKNDLIMMFNRNKELVIMTATPSASYKDWSVVHREPGPWNSEPLPDYARWRDEGILSLYIQKSPSYDHEPTDLYVIDVNLSTIRTLPEGAKGERDENATARHDNC